ncbi:MAG: hypothetical protein KGZ80_05970 [Methylomonas sp.]|nr:hypothetical protein [Methylomonas sp.]PPD22218.1 MAG: hypothetical protein CTY23_02640 [Methylomonas sp.]PPD27755.1 MAG: hypothetical protein CTY22_00930 [Methylomonas sp.]PPD39765.1 MAG: hypothetical protein CTY21_00925 [Methylomonas sp.]PPD42539.1 MAG: hypothetical protein CTY17_00820 [Methylomonas sp.]
MNINSLNNSAATLISNAQQKLGTAASDIARAPVQNNEVGGTETPKPHELFKAVLSAKEAQNEHSAGVKLLQAENNTIGMLIDESV